MWIYKKFFGDIEAPMIYKNIFRDIEAMWIYNKIFLRTLKPPRLIFKKINFFK